MSAPPHVLSLLEDGRRREKAQTLLYRSLAAEAEDRGETTDSERLNGLHADEQHHLSRLTARLLELGGRPSDLRELRAPSAAFEAWEDLARTREQEEISWYQAALAEDLDAVTRALMMEILESERHHMAELRGKWMSA